MNTLYFGDNLRILRDHVPDATADLVYLDPPFNSNATYNVLFAEESGSRSAAQITAFEDTWHWGEEAAAAYHEMVTEGPGRVSDLLAAYWKFLGPSAMMSYLAMMAPRLVELHRVMKPTASIYLHCDPTASHYLKLLMDAVFAPQNFRNEIIWKRTNARSTTGKWPGVHDVILYYVRSQNAPFTCVQAPGDLAKIPHTLITGPDGLKYQTYELTAPGVTRDGESGRPWRGFSPSGLGRHWANAIDVMEQWDAAGLIHWPARGKAGGFPRRRAAEPFVAEARSVVVGDVWVDIDRINQAAKERLSRVPEEP
jgi:site-specific DNA-methyltransferase (adenine-specific)